RPGRGPREAGGRSVVPSEELNHSDRVAEPADPLVDAVAVDRVDQPDAPACGERMPGARDATLLDPADAPLDLVDEADAHASSCSKACWNTTSGCAPRT